MAITDVSNISADETNTCATCKWSRRRWPLRLSWEFAYCMNPRNLVQDPVSGKFEPKYALCSTQREAPSSSFCGAEGRWWEKK